MRGLIRSSGATMNPWVVCAPVCVFVCISVSVCVYMSAYVGVYVCLYMCFYVCMRVEHMSACDCECICMCLFVSVHVWQHHLGWPSEGQAYQSTVICHKRAWVTGTHLRAPLW